MPLSPPFASGQLLASLVFANANEQPLSPWHSNHLLAGLIFSGLAALALFQSYRARQRSLSAREFPFNPPRPRRLAAALTALGRRFVRVFYHLEVTGLENLPPTGGVILAANHLSYADAVLLCAACPRLLRPVAWAGFLRHKFFRVMFEIFGCFPVSAERPAPGLRQALRALREGEAVLIFPEGGISLTGEVREFSGGCTLLARHSNVPVVPVYLDGLWGSIFSYAGGRFFWKWPRRLPYPVAVRLGAPVPAPEATPERLRRAVLALAPPAPSCEPQPSAPVRPAAA